MLVAMHGVNYARRGFSMEDFAALAQQAKESDEVPPLPRALRPPSHSSVRRWRAA
jgi:hypothetical protein